MKFDEKISLLKTENGAINNSISDYTDFLPNILRLNSKRQAKGN